MASEYLKKKYQNVKPDEKVELSKKEKLKNWWYYQRVPLLIGVIVLALVGSFVWEIVTNVQPDYQVAYIGQYSLPEGVQEDLLVLLEEMADDRNGDGEVFVTLMAYVINEEDSSALEMNTALYADLTVGTSEIFLVEDPMLMQEQFVVFLQENGEMPVDENSIENVWSYAWVDCPAVSERLNLGLDLHLICRGYETPEMIEEHVGYMELWNRLTEGAEKK